MPKRYLRLPDGTLVEYNGGSGGDISREEFDNLSEAIAELECGLDEEGLETYLEENSQDIATLTINLGGRVYSYNGGASVTIDIPDADNTSY